MRNQMRMLDVSRAIALAWKRFREAMGAVAEWKHWRRSEEPAAPYCSSLGGGNRCSALLDSRSACSRFRALHTSTGMFCSFHDVRERARVSDTSDNTAVFQCIRVSFEMWMKSIVGANITDEEIEITITVIRRFLNFASSLRDAIGDKFRFCETSSADYRLVHRFLEEQQREKMASVGVFQLIEAIRRFIVFRKFHQPVKGIMANPYAASEKLLEAYSLECREVSRGSIGRILHRLPANMADIKKTILHHEPKFWVIMSLLKELRDVSSFESDQDLDFATSFVCCFLCCVWPLKLDNFSSLLQDDVDVLVSGDEGSNVMRVPQQRGLKVSARKWYVSSSVRNIGQKHRRQVTQPTINRMRRRDRKNQKAYRILSSYVKHVHSRLSKTNEVLLLATTGLGLQPHAIRRKISTLIYEALGKDVAIGDVIVTTSVSSNGLSMQYNQPS